MFFIFGWGKGTLKDFGPCLPVQCPNCHNKSMWHLLFRRTWFSLFFIPVFPYDSRHYMMCNVCSYGFELHGSEIDQAKELCVAAKELESKTISPEEFQRCIDHSGLITALPDLSQSLPNIPRCPECGAPFNPANYDPDALHIYCSTCHAELPHVSTVRVK